METAKLTRREVALSANRMVQRGDKDVFKFIKDSGYPVTEIERLRTLVAKEDSVTRERA